MRRFWLQNELGERLDLTGNYETSGMFLASPTGLGFEYNDTFQTVKRGFYKASYRSQKQNTIGGTLIFLDPAYPKYQQFVNFVERAGILFFVYAPQSTEYYCQVSMGKIEKTQLTTQEASLQCTVSFVPHTMWYTLDDVTLNFGVGNIVSRYPDRYDQDARYGSHGQGIVKVQTRGHIEAALKIIAKGAMVNPEVKLIGISTGKERGTCLINKTFSTNEGFVLCTKYQDSYVRMLRDDAESEDLIDSVDENTDVFIHVPMDEDCYVIVTGGDSIDISGYLYDYYRSV